MRKSNLPVALVFGLLCLWAAPPVAAQERCLDGNFELGATLGPWSLFGDSSGAGFVQYDVDNVGGATWCLMRMPGSNFGNGGIEQDVLLIGGVTYQFDADIAYYSC